MSGTGPDVIEQELDVEERNVVDELRANLKEKLKEIEQLRNKIRELNALWTTRREYCFNCKNEVELSSDKIPFKSVNSSIDNDVNSKILERCSSYHLTGCMQGRVMSVGTQTFETDFLEADVLSECTEDFKPPVSSVPTVHDVVLKPAGNVDSVSDYVYQEACNMYYSPSTGYYFDTNRNLLYEPHSQTYYSYNEKHCCYELYSQVGYDGQDKTEAIDSAGKIASVNSEPVAVDITVEAGVENTDEKIQMILSKRKKKKYSNEEDGSSEDDHEKYDCVENKLCRHSENPYLQLEADILQNETCSSIEGELGSLHSDFLSTSTEDSTLSATSHSSVPCDDEDTEKWPPCIRAIIVQSSLMKIGSLQLVTCTGATIGRDKTCDLYLSDASISKTHAKITYDNEKCEYNIVDLGSQNGTFINKFRLSEPKKQSQPYPLKHSDYLTLGSCELLLHIHSGYDTCDECEPGQIQAKYNSQAENATTAYMSKEEREKERKKQLRQIKKRFGLEHMNYIEEKSLFDADSGYQDRASVRRKTKGSDNPYEKDAEPAALDKTLSSDNKGYQMLKKMGWKEGDSLGTSKCGTTEPVPLHFTNGKSGLGSIPSSGVARIPKNPRNSKWYKAQGRYAESTRVMEEGDAQNVL